MKKILPAIALTLLFALVAHPLSALDLDLEISGMQRAGKAQLVGESPETGLYMIIIEEVPLTSCPGEYTARELGLSRARRTVAEFIRSSVSSSTEETRETTAVIKNRDEETAIREHTRELIKIDARQLLRGVTLYRVERKGDTVTVIAFFSQKLADAAKVMAQAMTELSPDTVIAVGIGSSPGDPAAAREAALAAARRSAVEQVLGTSVAGSTRVDDDRVKASIFAASSGFIERYRVLEDTAISGGHKVVIVATVSKDKLQTDYSALAATLGDPGFYVRAESQTLYMSFVRFFAGLGLRVVPAPEGADYVIDVLSNFRPVKQPSSGIDGVQLSLRVRVLDARNNREVLTLKNDPAQSSVFYSSGDRQKEIAAEKAFAELKEPLHRDFDRLLGKQSQSGRPFEIAFGNYRTEHAVELNLISAALDALPGTSPPELRLDAAAKLAVLTVYYSGTPAELESRLRDAMDRAIAAKERIPATVSVSANRIEMNFQP
ncbi:MAG: hypothetical protein AB7F32_03150 [Victivallaceae bacterium]